jgi:hypothetical protein
MHHPIKRALLLILMIISVLGFGADAFAKPMSEHAKIVRMLDIIGSSNLTFIRNGIEYNAKEAKQHLQDKVDFFGDQIRTTDDFIKYVGSKSIVSDTPYFVRFPDGTEVEAAVWLRQQLAEMKRGDK